MESMSLLGATNVYMQLALKGKLHYSPSLIQCLVVLGWQHPTTMSTLNQDQCLQASATDNFSESTAFDVAIIVNESHYAAAKSLEELSECDKAMLSFVWSLTGGFFLALGRWAIFL